jgi:hypothetical protein
VDNELPAWNGNLFIYANGFQPESGAETFSNPSNVLWVPLLEKAYAQFCAFGAPERPPYNSYASLYGGLAQTALPAITGAQESSTYPFYDASDLETAIASGTLLTLATNSDEATLKIVGNHDYAVLGYDASNQTFELLNPWGWDYGDGYGIINLTWGEITEDFYLDGDCNPVSSVSGGAISVTTPVLGSRPGTGTLVAANVGSPGSNMLMGVISTTDTANDFRRGFSHPWSR